MLSAGASVPYLASSRIPKAARRLLGSSREIVRAHRTPAWFREAKFGITAQWTPQSVPEDGDRYARNMYVQGSEQYQHHLQHFGHPSKVSGTRSCAASGMAQDSIRPSLHGCIGEPAPSTWSCSQIIMMGSIAGTPCTSNGTRLALGHVATSWASGAHVQNAKACALASSSSARKIGIGFSPVMAAIRQGCWPAFRTMGN